MGIQMQMLLKEWKICGTKIYRTDENGEITIKTNGRNIKTGKMLDLKRVFD